MKNQLREKILKLRQKLHQSQIEVKSQKIFQNLILMDIFKDSKNIMAYMAFRNEVDTLPVINYCLCNDKKIILPISIKETRQLVLSELKDPDKELRKGTYGIKEPAPEYVRLFSPKELDLILVPAVAFDLNGYRLGYGGGYYDRFLSSLTGKIPTVGLAFEMQIIQKIPAESTDQPVDYIATEKKIIDCVNGKDKI